MLFFPPFKKHDAIGWQKAYKCWKTFLARKTKPNKLNGKHIFYWLINHNMHHYSNLTTINNNYSYSLSLSLFHYPLGSQVQNSYGVTGLTLGNYLALIIMHTLQYNMTKCSNQQNTINVCTLFSLSHFLFSQHGDTIKYRTIIIVRIISLKKRLVHVQIMQLLKTKT